ncbi:KUP/HAK/KT family potassium transporter [Sphingobacterium corticibacter]|uniref:Probable potassium transport system protein Kup n=1 Tax=Sphingobacterium corticibacter TaxID=2171749 RepID=A0A2T8HM95_9SPHI|nr:KUP/HAK/KT family potassium transporter [Sphingobacterium corticibacter]PVH26569.1 potassium transporter Kup [Sphingobacterium corticibacter]
MDNKSHLNRLSAAGLLISIGIIFGDIGTSPLYVFKAIFHQEIIEESLILGSLSCIFWTLTLQTTIKYVIITLRADNNGEGGILSLYSLVRRKSKWLIIPAIIGASTLLADGMITPAITISSAVEGLSMMNAHIPTVPIVVLIISLLFVIQRFGTSVVGRVFGPIMLIWFVVIGTLGILHIDQAPYVLKAFNPWYAVQTIVQHPHSLFIIGAIFLCTTGAEALYSDMGHCGKSNIRISWIFVKSMLLLNYLGQGAWLLTHQGARLGDLNPFFGIMPEWFVVPGIVIATIAAIVASQAMISGAYTLISEAVRLNIWPKVSIRYPSDHKGQLYVPSINLILYLGCILIIAVFRKSSNMEAAYGLAINMTFITTTALMCYYMVRKRVPKVWIAIFAIIYFVIELTFLAGNLVKFTHGGWLTLVLASAIFFVMYAWYMARKIKNAYIRFVDIRKYYGILSDLSSDTSIQPFASQLVYLTSANNTHDIEDKIVYSIINKKPKRADVYWFVHVDVMDTPHARDYTVKQLIPGKLVRIDFKLGFREEQKISLLFRKVVEDMVSKGEIDITSRYETLKKHRIAGDFNFVVLEKVFSKSSSLSWGNRIIMEMYKVLRTFSLSEEKSFGLDSSFVTLERVPLNIPDTNEVKLNRLN